MANIDVESIGPVMVAAFLMLINNHTDHIKIIDGDTDDKNHILFDDSLDLDRPNDDPNITYLDVIPNDILSKVVTQIFMDDFGIIYINVGEKVKV